jgi:hypothetical protein
MSISQNYPTIAPSLSLDFANVKKLDPRVTFARASTATYYGTQTAKAEENLLLQSQTFDNAYWTKTNITVTANSTTAPDGTTTAESILETATTGQHQVFRSAVITSSNTHVRSVFAKPNGRNWLAIYGGAGRSFFDLQNGVTGTVEAGYTASMIDAGNGWYRCILIGPAGTTSYAGLYNIADADNSISYAGDITKGLFIWGAQFEQRSAVTAYTPTTTQPITNYIPVLETAASGVARFDHNPVTTESLGLLIEEQRTNLLTYSEDFTDGTWVKSNTTITSNTITAPDSTLTGDKIVETSGAGVRQLYKTPSLSAVSHSFSAYFKASERYWFKLNLTGSGAYFDLSTGVIGTIDAGVTAAMTAVGNGWYRCSIVRTVSAGTNYTEIQLALTNGGGSYTGDGYSGIFIWGAQLEAGAFPTSYIPTVASQVTRSADSASMTGTNFSEWYRQDEGTVYVDYAANQTGGAPWELTQDGANRMVTVSGANAVFLVSIASSFVVANLNFASQLPAKWASAFKSGNYGASYNGLTALTNNYGSTLTNVSVLQIGASTGGNVPLNGTIKKIAYYPARLTNEQLQALTS